MGQDPAALTACEKNTTKFNRGFRGWARIRNRSSEFGLIRVIRDIRGCFRSGELKNFTAKPAESAETNSILL
jgi:hypothetical protein